MKLFAQLFGVWIGAMWCFMLSIYAAGVFSNEEFGEKAIYLGIISLFWLFLYSITCALERVGRKRMKGESK